MQKMSCVIFFLLKKMLHALTWFETLLEKGIGTNAAFFLKYNTFHMQKMSCVKKNVGLV